MVKTVSDDEKIPTTTVIIEQLVEIDAGRSTDTGSEPIITSTGVSENETTTPPPPPSTLSLTQGTRACRVQRYRFDKRADLTFLRGCSFSEVGYNWWDI